MAPSSGNLQNISGHLNGRAASRCRTVAKLTDTIHSHGPQRAVSLYEQAVVPSRGNLPHT